jgi:hypothetical protein
MGHSFFSARIPPQIAQLLLARTSDLLSS